MTLPRRRASAAHSNDLSSMDAPFNIPGPSKSTPKANSHQQATIHSKHSLSYTIEPTYADFLSSIDDWLEPYTISPSESSSSSQRRKRSTMGAIRSGSGSIANATSLKPKARSLRDATTAISANVPLDNTYFGPTYQNATTTHIQSQVPRAKSRILKSPPPPPALESNQQPPSLPNVDIQQIKDELSVSANMNHYYFSSGVVDGESVPQTPPRSRHQRHASSSTATSKETASVINNVKRRLSLKDRGAAVEHRHYHRQVTSVQPNSTRSSPLATSQVGGRKSRSISRTSLADYQGTPSPTSTRRRSVYSPPPPLPRPSSSYIQQSSKRGEDEWPFSDNEDGRLSTASISSVTAQNHDDYGDCIPPVPPVPKQHSMPSNTNTSSFISINTTTTTSTTEDDDMSTLTFEAYNNTFSLLDGEQQARSLVNVAAHGILLEDKSKSHQRYHFNEHARQQPPTSQYPITVPSTSGQKSPHGAPTTKTTKSESQQNVNDVNKVANRKRGRTLPGSLATPPPMPSVPLPPMKLAPIHIEVMPPIPQQSSSKARPHLMPPPKPISTLTHTPTKSAIKSEDDETLAGRSDRGSCSTTFPPPQRHRSPKLPSSISPKGAASTPRMRHSQSSGGKTTSATSTSPHRHAHSRPSVKRKPSSRNTTREQPIEPVPQLPTMANHPTVTSSTTALTAKTPKPSKFSHSERLTSLDNNSNSNNTKASAKLNRPKSLHSNHNNARSEPDGMASKKDHPRTANLCDELHPSSPNDHTTAHHTSSSTNSKYNGGNEKQSTSNSPPVRSPKSPQTALKYYYQYLSQYERTEILDFKHIYFIGPHAKKHQGVTTTRDHHHHRQQQQQQQPAAIPQASVYNSGYDDENGDYKIIRQDHLMYRYEIVQKLGQGSFGQVVKCFDHKTGTTVAIKLIRNKQRFHAQALTEIKLLRQLMDWDSEDKHHNIRMVDYFYFRHHLCIAFECMDMNLYEFIKKNHFQGFNVPLIRTFAIQILRSLILLYKHRVIHCDLKPENILLKHPNKNTIKVIDFGSSCLETERVYTYIQSRFYRAPEVILGISYNMSIDMWSFGCILAELNTGIPLFPGENESDQLGCIMEVLGSPDRYVIEQSSRKKLFFDSQGNTRSMMNSKGKLRHPGTRPLAHILRSNDLMFLDFVQGCLQWDPANRMTPMDAMNHDWIQQRTSHTIPSSYQFPSNSTTNYQKLDEFNKALRLRPHVHQPKTPNMTATSYIQSLRKHSVG